MRFYTPTPSVAKSCLNATIARFAEGSGLPDQGGVAEPGAVLAAGAAATGARPAAGAEPAVGADAARLLARLPAEGRRSGRRLAQLRLLHHGADAGPTTPAGAPLPPRRNVLRPARPFGLLRYAGHERRPDGQLGHRVIPFFTFAVTRFHCLFLFNGHV